MLAHVFGYFCCLCGLVLLVLEVLVELLAVLVEGALGLLELFFLHDDELAQSLRLFVLVVDRDLREQDLAAVRDVVADRLLLVAVLKVLLEGLQWLGPRTAVTFSLLILAI